MKTITVDDRERAPQLLAELQAKFGYAVELTRLPLGDYILPSGTLVERKTATDFALSIVDGRLFRQAYRLAVSSRLTVIIVEGSLATLPSTGISPAAVEGALITLAQTYRIPVLRTSSETDSAWHLHRLDGQRSLAPAARGIRGAGRKPRTVERRKNFVLASLPHVGPKLATCLRQHFGSVAAVVAANPAELAAIPGIGERRAIEIHETLHEAPGEYGLAR